MSQRPPTNCVTAWSQILTDIATGRARDPGALQHRIDALALDAAAQLDAIMEKPDLMERLTNRIGRTEADDALEALRQQLAMVVAESTHDIHGRRIVPPGPHAPEHERERYADALAYTIEARKEETRSEFPIRSFEEQDAIDLEARDADEEIARMMLDPTLSDVLGDSFHPSHVETKRRWDALHGTVARRSVDAFGTPLPVADDRSYPEHGGIADTPIEPEPQSTGARRAGGLA